MMCKLSHTTPSLIGLDSTGVPETVKSNGTCTSVFKYLTKWPGSHKATKAVKETPVFTMDSLVTEGWNITCFRGHFSEYSRLISKWLDTMDYE